MRKRKLRIKKLRHPQRWKVVWKYTYPLLFCDLAPDVTFPLIIVLVVIIII